LLLTKGMIQGKDSTTYKDGIGYIMMRLTGTKTRSTKFHSSKVVGESEIFAKVSLLFLSGTTQPKQNNTN